MKWLDTLRTYLGHDEDLELKTHPLDPEGAERAFKSAKNALDEAKQRRLEAEKVRSSLNRLNTRNHYGESIMISMMPRERRS